MRDEASMSV